VDPDSESEETDTPETGPGPVEDESDEKTLDETAVKNDQDVDPDSESEETLIKELDDLKDE